MAPLHHWMCELPKMATKVGEDEQEARARTEKGGLVWTAADALYRRYLQLNVENEEAPEGIEVPCVAWASGCEPLTFDPPNKVYYVDEPHFEEVRREILRKGFKLFIVSLKAGGKAPKRLGVRRLSEHLRATPRSGAAVQEETEKLVARYKERRAALTLSAGLSKSLPEDLAINVVRELRLQLSAKRGEVADVEVLSRRTEDGPLLINLDKDLWRALANGLATRIAHAASREPLFEILLRASGMDEVLDRLRDLGFTEEDVEVKHAENRPGTVYWSDIQYEKARELAGHDKKYFVVVLYPIDDRSYDVYWIWNPLDQLRGALRHVQWAGESDYQPVNGDTWEVTNQRPSQVPTRHYKFRIRLAEEVLSRAVRDSGELKALKTRVEAK